MDLECCAVYRLENPTGSFDKDLLISAQQMVRFTVLEAAVDTFFQGWIENYSQEEVHHLKEEVHIYQQNIKILIFLKTR